MKKHLGAHEQRSTSITNKKLDRHEGLIESEFIFHLSAIDTWNFRHIHYNKRRKLKPQRFQPRFCCFVLLFPRVASIRFDSRSWMKYFAVPESGRQAVEKECVWEHSSDTWMVITHIAVRRAFISIQSGMNWRRNVWTSKNKIRNEELWGLLGIKFLRIYSDIQFFILPPALNTKKSQIAILMACVDAVKSFISSLSYDLISLHTSVAFLFRVISLPVAEASR